MQTLRTNIGKPGDPRRLAVELRIDRYNRFDIIEGILTHDRVQQRFINSCQFSNSLLAAERKYRFGKLPKLEEVLDANS